MSTRKMLPILLIPVYNGGQLFSEAIDSIIPCLPWFDQVIISLNGVDVWDDKVTALRLVDRCRLTILTTGRTLSSVRHMRFIGQQLSKKMGLVAESQVFILCHDDLLYQDGFEALDNDAWQSFASHWVSLGDYLAFGKGTSTNETRYESWFSRYDSLAMRPKQKFMNTQYTRHDDPFTNVSGMRVSLGVLNATSGYFCATGSKTGMRFEYSLIVNRKVTHVVNFLPPLVCIRERPDSEGAMVTRSDFIASELRYALCIWLNCRTASGLHALLKGQYGITGLLWLIRLNLQHRYYELLGYLRLIAVNIGAKAD